MKHMQLLLYREWIYVYDRDINQNSNNKLTKYSLED